MNEELIKTLRIFRQHIVPEISIELTVDGIKFSRSRKDAAKTTNRHIELTFKELRVIYQKDNVNFYKNMKQLVSQL